MRHVGLSGGISNKQSYEVMAWIELARDAAAGSYEHSNEASDSIKVWVYVGRRDRVSTSQKDYYMEWQCDRASLSM
jgi:hypothetical protein